MKTIVRLATGVCMVVVSALLVVSAHAKDTSLKGKTYVKVFYPEYPEGLHGFYQCDEIAGGEVTDQFGNPWPDDFPQYDPIITAAAVCNSAAYDVDPWYKVEIHGMDLGIQSVTPGYFPVNADGSPIQGMYARVECRVSAVDDDPLIPQAVYLFCLETPQTVQ